MTEWIAVGLSTLALCVSVVTAWLTFFRYGELRMTQPTVIFFGPDGGRRDGQNPRLKVFLRTLLYSTSRRGQTVVRVKPRPNVRRRRPATGRVARSKVSPAVPDPVR